MHIEVYESEGEALEAAAALAEACLRDGATAQPAVGIAGGRGGRALMLALSGRDGIPWAQARFCVVDEPTSSRTPLRPLKLATLPPMTVRDVSNSLTPLSAQGKTPSGKSGGNKNGFIAETESLIALPLTSTSC